MSTTLKTLPSIAGEIVAFQPPYNAKVPLTQVRQALTDCGLKPEVARDLLPRHAFARACRRLEDDRVIRKVSGDADARTAQYQFTREIVSAGHATYIPEAFATIHLGTGVVTSNDALLESKLQTLVHEMTEVRFTGDITTLTRRLFRKNADLFPVRAQGGCYFVPHEHRDFIDRVEKFLKGIGGVVNRFPVTAGTEGGDRSMKAAVENGIAFIIDQHKARVAEFDINETRESTMQTRANKIVATRLKIEGYRYYLLDAADELLKGLEEAKSALKVKMGIVETEAAAA